ncbi:MULTISPECIES: sulfotransferase family protein [Kordiimonas]|mgnify:CR=1 FL=1|jgi:hypothetical protein|uniref:sulfotransferase family protein n=1 Tax=Kordiimonas TaxID=288021 RepID=UPI00257AD16B|nr:sulfotransferase [Kordiimonas sp. UBA4487]
MAYIFVGGSQRSGTSLLTTSLCAGEETNMYIGECPSLRKLLNIIHQMRQNFDAETGLHFGSRAALDEYASTIVRSYLSHTLTANAPATSLVLKEPHLTMLFPLMWHLIPESKFVLIKRDPRDIVVSMLRVGEKLADQGKTHLFNSGDVAAMALSAQEFYAPTINTANRNPAFRKAVTWVRYEEFVSDPATTIKQLRKTTGLKLELFDPENPTKRIHPTRKEARGESDRVKPWITEVMHGGAITSSRTGRFQEKLTEEQIMAIEKAVGTLLDVLGYDRVATSDRPGA